MRIAQTSRTDIERICLADAPFFLELVNNPTWLRYVGDRDIHDVKAAEDYLTNGILKHYEDNGYSYYAVRTKGGTAIGVCGFLKKPYLQHEDFGFAFLPAYQRQGYGFEAGLCILDYGVQHFGFQELDAVTTVDNDASIGLLEKLGFAYDRMIDIPDENEQLQLYRWSR